MNLRPFFSYFGAKWRVAAKYPPPAYETIVEPFAGSAGYACRHPGRRVLLVEKNPQIAGIWSYLIGASEREILSLPLLQPGHRVCDIPGLTQEQRWLIGMWVQTATASPRQTMTRWEHGDGRPVDQKHAWGHRIRSRIAEQLKDIRHWQVICGDYSECPDTEATWFIDAPYFEAGKRYPCGPDDIDFCALADWCRSRRGQVMVCEAHDATWLPFATLGKFHTRMQRGFSEGLWMNDWPGAALWLPAKETA